MDLQWVVHLRSISKFMIHLGSYRNESNRVRAASCIYSAACSTLLMCDKLLSPQPIPEFVYISRRGRWPAGTSGFEPWKFNFRSKRTNLSFSPQMAAALQWGHISPRILICRLESRTHICLYIDSVHGSLIHK